MMKISPSGLAALMEREGVRHDAYPDPATGGPPWTIGVGHTGPEVHPGLRWSDAQVMDALARDLARFERAVIEGAGGTALTQNQFDALVSFAFNVGTGAFLSSTLRRRLAANDLAGASAQFRVWIIPAMIAGRRAGEWVQFNTPDGRPVPARDQFDGRFP
ncbi:MAG: lysozyme [Reyranellaceae bacterium]